MKTYILPLLIIMVVAQWAVPIEMIWGVEHVLSEGDVYKFEMRPIDPSDPFRGKYITLDFETNHFDADTTQKYEPGQEVFVQLKSDDRGFATITQVFSDKPQNMNGILKTEVMYSGRHLAANRMTDSNQNKRTYVYVRYPFQRFYLEESKANKAEQLYWRSATDTTKSHTFYAVVKIKDGQAALQDVMINGRSIVEIVREINAKTKK